MVEELASVVSSLYYIYRQSQPLNFNYSKVFLIVVSRWYQRVYASRGSLRHPKSLWGTDLRQEKGSRVGWAATWGLHLLHIIYGI